MAEKFEDTKVVIRSRNSKDRQCNGQKKKGQKDKQWYIKHYNRTKDWAIRTQQKTMINSGDPKWLAVPVPQWHPSCYR